MPTADDNNIISLRRHLEALIEKNKENIDLKVFALKEATNLARTILNERLARMNEFRDALKDQSMLFLTKAEYVAAMEKVCADIKDLRESRAELRGKAEQSQVNISLALSVLGLMLGAASIILSFLKG